MIRLALILLAALVGCTSADAPVRTTLRLLCWNIHHGRGLDDRVDLDRIAALIESTGADIVALQEVDRGVLRTDRRDLPQELADRLGMTPVFGKNIDYQGGDYGNAVLTRLPVLEHRNHHYDMLRDGEQRGLLTVDVTWNGGTLRIGNTHLDYRGDDAERAAHAGVIVDRLLSEATLPTIVCGDFNDRPGSRTHTLTTTWSLDAWEVAGDGPGYTYPAAAPDRRIDWVLLAGPDIRASMTEVIETDASDHRPVLVAVQLER